MSSSLGALSSLPGKLRSLLVSCKNQIPDPLKDEVKLLIQDLEEARNLLVDLSGAEPPESIVKLWRNEVREMSYDLEDYIDKTTHPYSNQFEVEEFGTLVDLARDACKSYHRYHLGRLWPPNPSSTGTSGHGLVPNLNSEAKYIVGIDDARHKLISWLRDDAKHQLKVVPILGPAGVGKTTLAQEVYREIGGEYHCRAFVRASRMPDTRRLLRSIISQVQRHQQPPYGYTVQKLMDCLSEHLQNMRTPKFSIPAACSSRSDAMPMADVGANEMHMIHDNKLKMKIVGTSHTGKKRIVFQLRMPTQSKYKAMAVAAGTRGVESVAIAGDFKDRLVVVGHGVDSVDLINRLRKKVGGGADIVEIMEVTKHEKSMKLGEPPAKPVDLQQPQAHGSYYISSPFLQGRAQRNANTVVDEPHAKPVGLQQPQAHSPYYVSSPFIQRRSKRNANTVVDEPTTKPVDLQQPQAHSPYYVSSPFIQGRAQRTYYMSSPFLQDGAQCNAKTVADEHKSCLVM